MINLGNLSKASSKNVRKTAKVGFEVFLFLSSAYSMKFSQVSKPVFLTKRLTLQDEIQTRVLSHMNLKKMSTAVYRKIDLYLKMSTLIANKELFNCFSSLNPFSVKKILEGLEV